MEMGMSNGFSKNVQNFIIFGLSLGIASGAIIFLKERMASILANDPLHAALAGILFLTTFVYLIFWAIFSFKETEFLQEHLNLANFDIGGNEYIAYTAPIFFGLIFGLLFSLILNIVYYAMLLLIINIVACFLDTKVVKVLSEKYIALKASAAGSQYERQIQTEIFKYYFYNLYFFKHALTISLLFMALFVSKLEIRSGSFTALHVSYAILILTIIGSELLIWRWRIKRMEHINDIEKAHDRIKRKR
jgi:hypothetical protein